MVIHEYNVYIIGRGGIYTRHRLPIWASPPEECEYFVSGRIMQDTEDTQIPETPLVLLCARVYSTITQDLGF